MHYISVVIGSLLLVLGTMLFLCMTLAYFLMLLPFGILFWTPNYKLLLCGLGFLIVGTILMNYSAIFK